MTTTTPRIDIDSANHGTIIVLTARTAKARRWMLRHTDTDPERNVAIHCDHRCGIDILQAMVADGLVCRDAATGRVAGA